MGAKQVAALAAAAAAIWAAPAATQEMLSPTAPITAPTTMFYISVPLDPRTPKEQNLAFGLKLQGSRPYQTVDIDSRMFSFLPLGGLEVKWVVAGVVAAGTAAAIAHKDKSTSQRYQQQVQQQIQDCPQPPACTPK